MINRDLAQKIKQSDRVVSAITKNGLFRIAIIKNSETARTAQLKHNLDSIPALYLARMLAGASMMAVFLKGEERVILETEGSGYISKLYAEAIQVGECRGYLHLNEDIPPEELNNFTNHLGLGLFKVRRILYNEVEPITGIVELIKGDISTDLAYYYQQSEQIPSAVILDVDFDDSGVISHSGGIMIQAMPGATHADIIKIAEGLNQSKKISNYFENGKLLNEILNDIIPFELNILKNDRVDFFCRCSKEKFISKLLTFGLSEIISMRDKGNNELVCQYCNNHYYLDNSDFNRLIAEIKARGN